MTDDCTWFAGMFVSIMLILVALVLVVWFLNGHPGMVIFEDGSFIFGIVKGCLPGGLCNL